MDQQRGVGKNSTTIRYSRRKTTIGKVIPEEILLSILSKLPVKSLFQLKSVSKRWNLLISDPKFKLSVQRQHAVVISDYHARNFSLQCIDDGGSESRKITKPDSLQGRSRVRIRGSCNGCLLVSAEKDLFLWNPLLGYFNKVLSHEKLCDSGDTHVVSGPCHDESTDDYLVLLAITPYYDFQVEVFMVASLKNKTWTDVTFPLVNDSVRSGPVVNEHLHWLVTERLDKDYTPICVIVKFLPKTREFVKVPMPEPDTTGKIVGFGAIQGCLSLDRRTRNNQGYIYVHWILVSEIESVVLYKGWGSSDAMGDE